MPGLLEGPRPRLTRPCGRIALPPRLVTTVSILPEIFADSIDLPGGTHVDLLPGEAEFDRWGEETGPRGARRWRNLDNPRAKPSYREPPELNSLQPADQFEQGVNVGTDTHHASGIHRVTSGGKDYFFKRNEIEAELHQEVLLSHLALVSGVGTIPARMGEIERLGEGILMPWSDLPDIHKAAGSPSSNVHFEHWLDDNVPQPEIDKHLLFAFVTSAEDRHLGNYLYDPANRKIIEIDHELTDFKDDDPLDGFRCMMRSHLGCPQNFLAASVESMIQQCEPMARYADAFGREDGAAVIRRRGLLLEKWLVSGDLSPQGLKKVCLRGTT